MSRPKKTRAAAPPPGSPEEEDDALMGAVAAAAFQELVQQMGESFVTRAEYDQLAAQVRELSARLPAPPKPEISPQEIAIIAAAVTAYLGKPVRVRGARRLAPIPPAGPSPWQQQGRVSIQASHILGVRRSG
jgi:hypothetical protein